MDEFKAWLRKSGFWWNDDAIELGCSIDDSSGRALSRIGVRARRRLEIGEAVVRIPISACLACGNCEHSASVRKLQESLGEQEWLAALGFALMLERGGDGDMRTTASGAVASSPSRWAPYLDILPESESNVVMMWSDEQRRYLAGTDIEQALRDERAQAKMEWEGHIKPILAKLEHSEKSVFSFDKYLAARSIASSRAFTINPLVGVGLVPVADLFNHRTGGHHVQLTDMDEKLLSQSSAEAGRDDVDCLFMKIVKTVNEGEEVFNTYGELGNAKLLCSYGFAQVNNRADSVTIGLPSLRAAAALCGIRGAQIADRLAWCENNNICKEETTFHLRIDSAPSNVLLLLLWILTVSDEQFDVMRQVTIPNDSGTSLSSSLSVNEEMVNRLTVIAEKQGGLKNDEALQVLSEVLRRRRTMYAGASLGDVDSEHLRAWKLNISIVLDSEARIIRSCEKFVEENIKNDGNAGSKKRKVDSGDGREGQSAPEDAFLLFD